MAGVVALATLLVMAVRAPVRRAGLEAVRGHRVFGVGPRAVRGIEVTLEGRRFIARRAAQGWEIDGLPASAGTADALDDLLETLIGLRAVDVFRSRDRSSFGLERPRAMIDLVTDHGVRRVVLGATNATGGALYARREGDPRVLQVGIVVLSEVERVFFNRDAPQRPEIG